MRDPRPARRSRPSSTRSCGRGASTTSWSPASRPTTASRRPRSTPLRLGFHDDRADRRGAPPWTSSRATASGRSTSSRRPASHLHTARVALTARAAPARSSSARSSSRWRRGRSTAGSPAAAARTRPAPLAMLAVVDAPIDADLGRRRRHPAPGRVDARDEVGPVRRRRGPLGVGTRGRGDRPRSSASRSPTRSTITGVEPPTRYAIRHEGLFAGGGMITLEPGADGTTTIVRWEETPRPAGAPRTSARSSRPPILRAIFQADLRRLKRLVEAGGLTAPMQVHLVDATYELFRAHFAPRPPVLGRDGILLSGVSGLVEQLLLPAPRAGRARTSAAPRTGSSASFRNDLYPGYKTEAGMDPELLAQFPIAEAGDRGAGPRPVADGRVRGRRRDRRRGRAVRRRPAGRADPRLHPRQGHGPAASRGERIVLWDRRREIDLRRRGRPREVGRRRRERPRPARARRRRGGRLPGAPRLGRQVGVRGPGQVRPPRGDPGQGSAWDVPGLRNPVGLAATLRDHMDEALLYRDLARLRTIADGVPIPQRTSTSSSGRARTARRWQAFCDEWGLARLRDRPHRWLGRAD